jgi:aromatic-L-amino-acid decarboxylase
MTKPEKPLEPGREEMRALAARVLDILVTKIDGLDAGPAMGDPPSPELLAEVSKPPPAGPGRPDELLDLALRAAEASYETAGGSYLAYIPGGGVFSAAVAEFLAAGLNRYTGRSTPAPALVAQEQSTLRWMCDLFDFPPEGQGLLTTGGSISNLIALAAARTRHADGRVDRATLYVGEHAHGSLAKAARTIGIGRERIRVIRSTADLRLDVEHLRARIVEDRRAGLLPFCVCAAAGTTNTGTVDPLADAAAVAADENLWFHVDGAYGGFFQLTERGHRRLSGIERADSITLDPHKSLFLPYGIGALVVRSADSLRQAFTEGADYLQDLGDSDALPDFDSLGPELTRDFRGLRLWLPLHLHGVDAFREQLDEKLDLASMAFQALADDPRFEVPWRPDLSVLAFRLAGADDAAQKELIDRINASRRVLLSSTRIQGRVWIRIAILSFRTHRERIQELLEIISRAAEAVRGTAEMRSVRDGRDQPGFEAPASGR